MTGAVLFLLSEEFTRGAAAEFGRLDGIVNNAGRSLMSPVTETTREQWREEFDLKISC